jgi:hypothetical protein
VSLVVMLASLEECLADLVSFEGSLFCLVDDLKKDSYHEQS